MLKLSLSKKGKCKAQDQENSEQFEFISDAKVERLEKKLFPRTQKVVQSGRSLTIWDKRNGTFSDKPSEQVPQDLASKYPAEILKWVMFNVAEALFTQKCFCCNQVQTHR